MTDGDREIARSLFALIRKVFEEAPTPLSDGYLDRLLRRDAFWAIAAFVGDELVGGITAHLLPMTRAEASELFIYDLAVRADWQRHGIGRYLVTSLREQAAVEGIQTVFVPRVVLGGVLIARLRRPTDQHRPRSGSSVARATGAISLAPAPSARVAPNTAGSAMQGETARHWSVATGRQRRRSPATPA